MRAFVLITLGLIPVLLAAAGGRAAERPVENQEVLHADPAAVQRFRDGRFGVFIHWGVYSLLGRGEWVMNNEGIPIAEYEKLPPQFNPTGFDAHEWVKLAKDAGAKYITITSKHHDGFCMFDSKLTDYDIVDRTPFKRDPLKELAAECHRQGIQLFFYYSQLDWHHPDYFPRGGTGKKSGRPESGDWNRYKEYYIGQVRELCTNYGEIGGIWFDGWWDRPSADWGHEVLYPMIHRLQPRALVGNNHHHAPFPGEDFQMFEQDLPGENSAGFNTAGVSALPKETCRTINNSWGLNTGDHADKSATALTQYLIQAAGRDANLLLNTGPLPNGTLLPEHRDRYLAMGTWLRELGTSIIYKTRGGPFPPAKWGVSTWRGRDVFLHVLNWPADNTLHLPGVDGRIRSTRSHKGGKIRVEQTPAGITVTLPDSIKDPVDSLVVLEMDRVAGELKLAPPAAPSG
jgi:alpha-L-fucosidase